MIVKIMEDKVISLIESYFLLTKADNLERFWLVACNSRAPLRNGADTTGQSVAASY